jgi:hypothetical protein
MDIDAIPSKRIAKRVKLIRQGELARMIVGALREAYQSLSTQAITTAIIKAGGHGASARSAVMPRVRVNLAYLHNRGKVRAEATRTCGGI